MDIPLCMEIRELLPAQDLSKLIECPICNEVPFGPIWQCENGHNVCDVCRSKISWCPLCRGVFNGARNFTVENIILGSNLSCPYQNLGCTQIISGSEIKEHAAECNYGPKLKWVEWHAKVPENAIRGGMENGQTLYVIRAHHNGLVIPGKFFEYNGEIGFPPAAPLGIISHNGGIFFKSKFEILVGEPGRYKWIPSSRGQTDSRAIRGGTAEHGEPLFIGRMKIGPNVINGKVQRSQRSCLIPTLMEVRFPSYYLLVSCDPPTQSP